MKLTRTLATALVIASAGSLLAKDEQAISIEACPAAVKTVIQENLTRSRGTLQKLEKETVGGVVLYDAKIIDGNRKRWSLKLTPEGKVVEAKEKPEKAKTE